MNIMKSKITFLIATLFLIVCSLSVNGQTEIPKGKMNVKSFSNANAKFTVPDGKIWYVTNVFSSLKNSEGEKNYIFLKSLDDVDYKNNGPCLSNYARNYVVYPIILPSNTTFEILISDNSAKAFILYTEVDN